MKVFIIIVLTFTTVQIFAQQVAVANEKANIAYPKINNHLTIVVENIPCADTYVTTNNGAIEKSENSCEYIFKPDFVGSAILSVYKIEGKDTSHIADKKYRIKSWGMHIAYFGGRRDGVMSKVKFLAQEGLTLPMAGMNISGYLNIYKYKIDIVRKGDLLYTLNNRGGRFSKENYAILKKIKVGDIVIFYEVKTKMPGELAPRTLNDITVRIR